MKRLIIALMTCMILIAGVSAFEFDNVKEYNEAERKVTIKDSLLGIPTTTVATLKLETPHMNYVPNGDDVMIAKIKIDLKENEYINPFKEMDFYDRRGRNKEKGFNYKILKTRLAEKEKTIEECHKEDGRVICKNRVIGTEVVEEEYWEETDGERIKKGEVTLGIFTDVKMGEVAEWIPRWMGVEIREWAWYTGLTLYEVNVTGRSEHAQIKRNYPLGQKFKVGTLVPNVNFTLKAVNVTMKKQGSPTGQIQAVLYNASSGDGIPDTSQVYSKGTVNVSALTAILAEVVFNMSDYTVRDDLDYAIAFFCDGCPDDSNDVRMSYESDDPTNYSGGSYIYDNGGNGSSWAANEFDATLGVWGIGLVIPTVNITFPQNKTYDYIVDEINYTAGDDPTPADCWYSTDKGLTNSTSVACGVNFTGLSASGGNNTWTVYANSTDNGIGNFKVNFQVSLSNFTLKSYSLSTNQTILDFNASIDGVNYTTLDGLLETPIGNESTSLYNTTITAQGFEDNITLNNNLSQIVNFSLNPNGFTNVTANVSHDNTYFYTNATINCTYQSSFNATSSIDSYTILNTNDSYKIEQTTQQYKLNHTDFQDELMFWCNISNIYQQTVSSNATIPMNTVDSILTLNALNYAGSLIASMTWGGQVNYTGNPVTLFLSDYISKTVGNWTMLNITLNDPSLYNQPINTTLNITEELIEHNITMVENQLVLEFYQDGSPIDVRYELSDVDKVFRNNSASAVAVQQNLSIGKVKVVFANTTDWANWTQFYEYENTRTTHITETLEVLQIADWTTYFKILDSGNSPVADAVVRVEYTNTTEGSYSNYSLMGQRLSNTDGTVLFYFDSNAFMMVTVTATGYEAKELLIKIGDESASTKATAIPIYLSESTGGVSNNVWVYIPNKRHNYTIDIKGLIMAKSADTVKVNTDYRQGLGLGFKELTDDNYGRYPMTLVSGTDIPTTETDIIVILEIDGTNSQNWTITAGTDRIFVLPTTIETDTMVVIASIGLIATAGIIGTIFTSATVGFSVFMIGSILLTLIDTSFIGLSLVCLIYFALKFVRRVIGE